jgi:hypothetical protein
MGHLLYLKTSFTVKQEPCQIQINCPRDRTFLQRLLTSMAVRACFSKTCGNTPQEPVCHHPGKAGDRKEGSSTPKRLRGNFSPPDWENPSRSRARGQMQRNPEKKWASRVFLPSQTPLFFLPLNHPMHSAPSIPVCFLSLPSPSVVQRMGAGQLLMEPCAPILVSDYLNMTF